MATPSITVRGLDPNGDPIQGNGKGAFIQDIEAVAQIIRTTILLLQNEWFEDLTQGTPMFQTLLAHGGASTDAVKASILQDRILSVPFVNEVQNMQYSRDAKRNFFFYCEAFTTFGTITVSNQPSTAALNQ